MFDGKPKCLVALMRLFLLLRALRREQRTALPRRAAWSIPSSNARSAHSGAEGGPAQSLRSEIRRREWVCAHVPADHLVEGELDRAVLESFEGPALLEFEALGACEFAVG